MKYKKIRTITNVSLVIFVFLTVICLFLCIGGGGVLNDLYLALEEIENLESRNLLKAPPEDISPITEREIGLVHNSAGLKKYINETHAHLSNLEIILFVFTSLSFLTLLVRICFRKRQ